MVRRLLSTSDLVKALTVPSYVSGTIAMEESQGIADLHRPIFASSGKLLSLMRHYPDSSVRFIRFRFQTNSCRRFFRTTCDCLNGRLTAVCWTNTKGTSPAALRLLLTPQDKVVGSIAVRLLTGPTIGYLTMSPVHAEVACDNNRRYNIFSRIVIRKRCNYKGGP